MKNQEAKSNKKLVIIISIVLAVVFLGMVVYILIDNGLFGIDDGSLKPIDQYTLSDYEDLSAEEKEEFKARFESEDKFDDWLFNIQNESKNNVPWENGGKTPDQYTMDEFEVLDSIEKIAFSQWFESEDEFYAWQDKAEQGEKAPNPWETEGAKQPDQYT
ncbi:MAG: hypothetical protein IJ944_04795, partial [Clostridia bacterium]|nr:hypothetical protein [Clostridia bacterium]